MRYYKVASVFFLVTILGFAACSDQGKMTVLPGFAGSESSGLDSDNTDVDTIDISGSESDDPNNPQEYSGEVGSTTGTTTQSDECFTSGDEVFCLGANDESEEDIAGLLESEDDEETDSTDQDGDGIPDLEDNCPYVKNPGQYDQNEDLIGNACDYVNDADKDGLADAIDPQVTRKNTWHYFDPIAIAITRSTQKHKFVQGRVRLTRTVLESSNLSPTPTLRDPSVTGNLTTGIEPSTEGISGLTNPTILVRGVVDRTLAAGRIRNCPNLVTEMPERAYGICIQRASLIAPEVDDVLDSPTLERPTVDDTLTLPSAEDLLEKPTTAIVTDGPIREEILNRPLGDLVADNNSDPVEEAAEEIELTPVVPDRGIVADDFVSGGEIEVVEKDADGDGIATVFDNCPNTYNKLQSDQNKDGIGDACDFANDADGDGLADAIDGQVSVKNVWFYVNQAESTNEVTVAGRYRFVPGRVKTTLEDKALTLRETGETAISVRGVTDRTQAMPTANNCPGVELKSDYGICIKYTSLTKPAPELTAPTGEVTIQPVYPDREVLLDPTRTELLDRPTTETNTEIDSSPTLVKDPSLTIDPSKTVIPTVDSEIELDSGTLLRDPSRTIDSEVTLDPNADTNLKLDGGTLLDKTAIETNFTGPTLDRDRVITDTATDTVETEVVAPEKTLIESTKTLNLIR